jgi:hypothetical protein
MRSLLVLLVSAGCIDYTPDVGPLNAGVTDGGTTTTVSFSRDIRPLMFRSPGGCGGCHIGRAGGGISGLDLGSYTALRRGGSISGTRIIVDEDPCASTLVSKLSRIPTFGSRMPFNGPPYFTADEVQLVRDWIVEGALNN